MDDQSEQTAVKLPFLERHPVLYARLFQLWDWYAVKVLRIPFKLAYQPRDQNRLKAMTYSWDLMYVQQIKNNWDLQERYNHQELQLKRANDELAKLREAQSGNSKK